MGQFTRTALASALLLSFSWQANAADVLPAAMADVVVVNSQTWRSAQANDDYVIQLVSVKDTKHLPSAKDIADIKQVDPNLDVVYHPKRVNGVTWHTLVWGAFDSKEAGKAMFSKLPAKWQKMQPWARPMSSIEGAALPPKVETKPAVVAQPKPQPKPAVVARPKATPKVSKKSPVSAPDRSQFSKTKLPYQDPYENHGEDFSNHESAMAAQGTYPYLKLSLGGAEQSTDGLVDAATNAGAALNITEDAYGGDAYELAVGLDIGYYVGVELGYIDATDGAATINAGGASNAALSQAFKEAGPFGFKGWKASVLGKLPIDERRQWQPFVQLGAIAWKTDVPALGATSATTQSETDLFYALGMDYKFTKHWALGLKYTGYNMEAEGRALTADLSWRWEGRN